MRNRRPSSPTRMGILEDIHARIAELFKWFVIFSATSLPLRAHEVQAHERNRRSAEMNVGLAGLVAALGGHVQQRNRQPGAISVLMAQAGGEAVQPDADRAGVWGVLARRGATHLHPAAA